MGTKKQKQRKVPTKLQPIHEWYRRLNQAGYVIPVPRKPHTIPEKVAAFITIALIAGMTVLAVYAGSLPNRQSLPSNQPEEWHAQTSQSALK